MLVCVCLQKCNVMGCKHMTIIVFASCEHNWHNKCRVKIEIRTHFFGYCFCFRLDSIVDFFNGISDIGYSRWLNCMPAVTFLRNGDHMQTYRNNFEQEKKNHHHITNWMVCWDSLWADTSLVFRVSMKRNTKLLIIRINIDFICTIQSTMRLPSIQSHDYKCDHHLNFC